MTSDNLLKTVQVAKTLDVDRSTVTRWAQQGVLKPALIVPGYKGDYLFAADDVEAMRRERDAAAALRDAS